MRKNSRDYNKKVLTPHPDYGKQVLDLDSCFLCGTCENITREHVFPKWLINRFNLNKEKLTLLNSTTIPYNGIIVPCCRTCNNEILSKLESKIQDRLNNPSCVVTYIEKSEWYLWILKIFY